MTVLFIILIALLITACLVLSIKARFRKWERDDFEKDYIREQREIIIGWLFFGVSITY